MAKIDSEVLIKAESLIPIEIKQTALSWKSILLNNVPFLVTIAIVLGSAVVTFYISRKDIKTQEEQSAINRQADHENKISHFRHDWLNNLRDTASELAKCLHLCQMSNLQRNCSTEHRNAARTSDDDESYQEHQNKVNTHYSDFIKHRADFYQLHAKIKLFFKADDSNAEELLRLLIQARNQMGNDSTTLDNALIDSIVDELQVILKNEWEVTKDRAWVKGT
ncbi:hypothetical protein [Vibrio sp. V15_P4S5T153]|uniref:hypothetical protein n=1 Tax=Vibrio sp. V15_P4S5T153 TaxID=1938669 RepID=UPI000B908A73|nr:hypothetical protein [Vibrio sp. V15_P4S5T153]OXX63844.1 hypothetical protein B9J89_06095 [Vibrio sp. V15_P4S5T153]